MGNYKLSAKSVLSYTFSVSLIACSGGGGGGSSPDTSSANNTKSYSKVAPTGVWVLNRSSKYSQQNAMRVDPSASSANVVFPNDNAPTGDEVYPDPSAGVFCGGSVFVGSYSYNALTQIDPNYNRVTNQIPKIMSDAGMTCANNKVWAISTASLSLQSYDLLSGVTNTITTGGLGGGAGIAATSSGVWVLSLDSSLIQVNPSSGSVMYSISINSGGGSYTPLGMTSTGTASDHVWIVSVNNATNKLALQKFNTSTKKFDVAVDMNVIGLNASSIALGTRLDLAEDSNGVWFPAFPINTVLHYTESGALWDTVSVGNTPWGIAAGFNSIWVTNAKDNTLTKIDSASAKVVSTIAVGNNPVRVVISK